MWREARIGFAIFLVVVGPFLNLPAIRRLRANSTAAERLKLYWIITAYLIVMGLIAWWLMWRGGAVCPVSQAIYPGIILSLWLRVTLAMLAGAFFGLALQPGVTALFRPRLRIAYTKGLAKSGLEFIMPRGRLERSWWFALSLAAGVFEEVIFRGLLLQVARMELGLGLMLGLSLTSVVFGLNHLYQKTAGMVKSAVTGVALGTVAVVTGGLIVPMVLHAALDLQILAMYRPGEEQPSTANADTVS